jgi:hypothetical protein
MADRAKYTALESTMRQLQTATYVAQISTQQTLNQIT